MKKKLLTQNILQKFNQGLGNLRSLKYLKGFII